MKIFKESFKYAFKNLWAILLFTLPLSVFYCFLLKPNSLIFLKNSNDIVVKNFNSIQHNIFDFSLLNLIFSIVLFISVIVIVSLLFSSIEYHLRTGKFSFKKSFNQIKQYLFPVFFVCLLLSAFYLLFAYLFSAILYLVIVLSGGIGHTISNQIFVFSVLLYLIILSCFAAIFTLFIFNSISSSINRYRFKESISYVLLQFEGSLTKLFLFFLLIALVVGLCFTFIGGFFLSELVNAVILSIALAIIISTIMVSYFQINRIERKDNIKTFF